jgi:hypothetical protein
VTAKGSKKSDGKKEHRRLAVYLPKDASDKLEDLRQALSIESYSAVISQAIARWHHQERLVQKMLEDRRALLAEARSGGNGGADGA